MRTRVFKYNKNNMANTPCFLSRVTKLKQIDNPIQLLKQKALNKDIIFYFNGNVQLLGLKSIDDIC